jgi:hypothetical protein
MKTTDAGHADLAGEQHVLARLGHRAVRGRDHEDRAVHLGGAGDHVLHEVGVARAVDVGVVTRLGLVLILGDVHNTTGRHLFRSAHGQKRAVSTAGDSRKAVWRCQKRGRPAVR